MSATFTATLHVPDEPVALGDRWRDAVLGGRDLGEVLAAPDGLVPWLWSRWLVLRQGGLDPVSFEAIVLAYRREIWLWLAGERTWAHACSGLIGRTIRRLPA